MSFHWSSRGGVSRLFALTRGRRGRTGLHVKNHLGPTLRREHPSLKLLGFDHNKDTVAQWARELYSHPESAQYVDGLGVHWYMGTFFDNLQEAHDVDPSKLLVATEACDCPVSPPSRDRDDLPSPSAGGALLHHP